MEEPLKEMQMDARWIRKQQTYQMFLLVTHEAAEAYKTCNYWISPQSTSTSSSLLDILMMFTSSVYVCVCVWTREREKGSEQLLPQPLSFSQMFLWSLPFPHESHKTTGSSSPVRSSTNAKEPSHQHLLQHRRHRCTLHTYTHTLSHQHFTE